tara:strand:+ start:735 stop:1103 length:369 start_codon:yes stop_codon:yes gene_type:complete
MNTNNSEVGNVDCNNMASIFQREFDGTKNSDDLHTRRLNIFLDAIKEIPVKGEFDGLDLITITDLDRLKVFAKVNSKLKNYIDTTPGIVNLNDPVPACAHAYHLKVVVKILPKLVELPKNIL